MPEFLDYDPDTGIRHDYDFNEETGEAHIHCTQDVQALLDYNKSLANAGNDSGIKQNWWLYAKLPPIFFLKLRARGYKLDNSDDTARLMAEINTNFPALKCTTKNHGKKLVLIHDLGTSGTPAAKREDR